MIRRFVREHKFGVGLTSILLVTGTICALAGAGVVGALFIVGGICVAGYLATRIK